MSVKSSVIVPKGSSRISSWMMRRYGGGLKTFESGAGVPEPGLL
jgi:hypothetical protein